MPLISVILTSFNHGNFIREAIDSVLSQSFHDFELIIWDDASIDNSWEIIESYRDSRIRTFRNPQNKGPVFGINKAIFEIAQGKYVAIHHSDDVWELNKLQMQVDFLEANSGIGAVFSNARAIDERGAPLTDSTHFYYNVFSQANRSRYDWLRYFFLSGNALCHPSILIRKQCYVDCGPYLDMLAQVPDFDMWVRLCTRYEIHVLPDRLVRFRVRDGEMNSSGNRPMTRIRGAYEYYKLLQRYRSIVSAENIFKIFPEFLSYDRGANTDPEYVLARVGLESESFFLRHLLANEIQFDILNNPERRSLVESTYHFSPNDFIAITGKHDLFSREEVLSLQVSMVERERNLVEEHSKQIDTIMRSRSWQITAPLRWESASLQTIRRWIAKDWFDKNTWRVLFRAVYMRSVVLRAIHQKYLPWKFRVASKIEALPNSSDNLLALQALSSRRFDKQALLSAIGVTRPVEWPEIDVSVVSYNSSRWVGSFIASLVSQHYPLSKIHLQVVDHGSQDDTVLQLEKLLAETGLHFASTQIIQQANLGFGAGHDRAIKDGKSEYCLVTNLDLEFSPNSLCDVVRVALSDKDGVVASWELRQIPYEHPKYYDPVTLETDWSSHACILIRRSAYNKVGGYDPSIFMYAEDVELSYRFRSYGYVLKYVPGAVVNHFTYESAGQVKPLQFSGSAIGNLYIRLRYGKASDRLSGLLQYTARFFWPSPFDGAKSLLLKNAFKLVVQLPHFLRGKGKAPAYFPLRGFDYEMTRDGAFREIQPCPAADVAPLVTVITRTYRGRGMFLAQAMQSIFNQTYPAIELLVVEDGGDSQQALVTSLAERAPSGCRVRFLANEMLGRSAAGNAALAAAEGSFLMFLDDDDLLFSDHVETLVSALSRDTMLSAAYALAIEVHTKVDPAKSTYIEELFHTPGSFRQEWDYDVLLDHNFIPIQAILFKRELYEQLGGFDTELDQLEDWNLWLRYGYGNQFVYVPKTTSLFRSPSDYEARSARHTLLHNAYNDAKERAVRSLEQLGAYQ